jgi:hypothetical protein
MTSQTHQLARRTLSLAKNIQEDVPKRGRPPDEGFQAESQQVIPFSVGYSDEIVH